MSDTVIACRDLGRSFDEGGQSLEVLRGLNLAVGRGESLAIVGQSGSGKSTLLHLLGGLDTPNTGVVELNGQDLSQLSDRQRTRIRNQALGFVYQFHHLLPEFSALENVALPLRMSGLPWGECQQRAAKVLATVGLAQRLSHRPGQLSGGERQRVAVARALVTEPRCVLADEPTGNLDQETGSQVFSELLRLQQDLGTALVLVTHDRQLAKQANRCLELRAGQLQEAAPVAAHKGA